MFLRNFAKKKMGKLSQKLYILLCYGGGGVQNAFKRYTFSGQTLTANFGWGRTEMFTRVDL